MILIRSTTVELGTYFLNIKTKASKTIRKLPKGN